MPKAFREVLSKSFQRIRLFGTMTSNTENGFREHWKSLAACTLISMSPFQYGVDFTMIGGFQAMIGFLEVC